MSNSDLERTLAQVRSAIEADLDVLALVAVGSIVSGEVDEWSDIDLVLVMADHALERYYVDTRWLQALGIVYTFRRSSNEYRRMVRICLQDLRRVDLIIVAKAYLVEYASRPGPLQGGHRLLLSRGSAFVDALVHVPPGKPPPHAEAGRFEDLEEAFWWNAVLAIVKAGRGDLLTAGFLALEVVQSYFALRMMLRDRETGTRHHPRGDGIPPRMELPPRLTTDGLLSLVERAATQWDELAQSLRPSTEARRGPLLALVQRVRDAQTPDCCELDFTDGSCEQSSSHS